jgi:hypothetical protein
MDSVLTAIRTDRPEREHSQGVLAAFSNRQEGHGGAVILTGTAGDGKSYLCGQVWDAMGGSPKVWASNDVYFCLPINLGDRRFTLHVIRDLTALPDTDPGGATKAIGPASGSRHGFV